MDISPREGLLEVVREAFGRKGTWPRRQHVEAVLDQDYGFDLEDALAVKPHSQVRAEGTAENSEVILTVAGLAAAGAEHEVGLFIEALRWCVDTALGFRPSDPDVTEEVKLESGDFRSEWETRGVEIDDTDLAKLHAMFLTEGIYGGMSGAGAEWTITLDRRRLVRFREVQTLSDYLAVREAAERSPAAPPPVIETPPAMPGAGIPDEIPMELREACGVLFAQRNFQHAALEAVKVMTEALQGASGLRLDGNELARRAFDPKAPSIVVGDLATETGRSRQRGLMLIAQGIYAAVRNPLAHERIRLSEPEARQILAMIGFVLAAVDARRPAGVQ